MKGTLGWLLVALCLWNVETGFAEAPSESETQETVSSSTAKQPEYRFDAERFGKAMDRATGKPIEGASDGGGSTVNAASLTDVLGRTILSLIVVIGAIYGFTFLVKKMGMKAPFQSEGPLRVLAKQGLSQKSTLYIVSTLDRFLIIGESAQGLTCLSELDDVDEVDRLKREWGWDSPAGQERVAPLQSGKSMFSPTLRSHMEDLERELQEYEEVRR